MLIISDWATDTLDSQNSIVDLFIVQAADIPTNVLPAPQLC